MMTLRAKYFFIAVVIVGTVGIWLPLGIEKLIYKSITWHNVPQNMTTYFISILFAGCVDYFLTKLSDMKGGLKSAFLNVISLFLLLTFLSLSAIITYIFKEDILSIVFSAVGILVAWKLWWIANEKNPNFIDAVDSIGGNPEKPLSIGG